MSHATDFCPLITHGAMWSHSSLEFQLLTLCAVPGSGGLAEHEITRILDAELAWPHFLFLTAKNQIVPLVYSRLSPFAARVPRDVIETLRRRCAAIASWNLFLASELNVLLRGFSEQDICAVPFKGPTLAMALYGDLSLRQGDDLDIFVEPADLDRAMKLLENSGYRRTEFAGIRAEELVGLQKDVVLENANGVSIELHWAICDPAFNDKLRDFTPCRRTSGTVKILDSLVPMASPEDTMFMLSVHGIRHYWNRLKWICDIGQLVRAYPELDWNKSLETSDAFSCRRTFLLPHALGSELLGIPVPARLAGMVQKDSALRGLVNGISVDLASDIDAAQWPQCRPVFKKFAEIDISQKIFRVRSKDSFRERMKLFSKLIRDFIRPDPADLLAWPFLSKFKFIFWIIQPLRLLRSCGFGFFSRATRHLLAALVR